MREIEVAERPESPAPRLLRLERLTLNLAAVWLLASSEPVACVWKTSLSTCGVATTDSGTWRPCWLTLSNRHHQLRPNRRSPFLFQIGALTSR